MNDRFIPLFFSNFSPHFRMQAETYLEIANFIYDCIIEINPIFFKFQSSLFMHKR